MIEALKMHGAMTAHLIKKDGTTQTIHKDNMIVNVGFDFIADSIGNVGSRPGVMRYIAVGNNNTPTQPTTTQLGGQIAYKEATYYHGSSTKIFTFTTTFAPGEATGTIKEASVFNSNRGTMFDRVVFSDINKAEEDTLKIVFTFTIS